MEAVSVCTGSVTEDSCCCHLHLARSLEISLDNSLCHKDPTSVLTLIFRFLDSKGEDCGVTARDSFALSMITQTYDLKNNDTATDLEKKMTKMAASLVVTKVKEEIKEREEEEAKRRKEDEVYPSLEGINYIYLVTGTKNSINGVKNLKYVWVLFHNVHQLFLTVEGKGKKGLKVEAYWLSWEEIEEAVDAVRARVGAGGGPGALLEDYMAKRGLVSLGATDIALPLQCEAEGKPRRVLWAPRHPHRHLFDLFLQDPLRRLEAAPLPHLLVLLPGGGGAGQEQVQRLQGGQVRGSVVMSLTRVNISNS